MLTVCASSHLHDHVEQALPPLHVAGAHERKGDGRVEVRARDVGKGVDCMWSSSMRKAEMAGVTLAFIWLSTHGVC